MSDGDRRQGGKWSREGVLGGGGAAIFKGLSHAALRRLIIVKN